MYRAGPDHGNDAQQRQDEHPARVIAPPVDMRADMCVGMCVDL